MEKYSILINTCDAYSDVWEPFFKILKQTWPEAAKHKIYLNTETKSYKDTFFDVKVLNSVGDKNMSWGTRLVKALERIDSEYVLFMLEDFFFEEQVLDNAINDCFECLESDKHIACISLNSERECSDKDYCEKKKAKIIKGFIPKKHFAAYKISAGPGLWRKESLIKWTSLKDSPWEWEFFGSIRTWTSRDKFYGRAFGYKPIFKYDVYYGGAVHRGKWVGYKVRELNEKYHLGLDLDKRGVVEDWRNDSSYQEVKPISQRLSSVCHNRWKMFSCFFQGLFLDLKH